METEDKLASVYTELAVRAARTHREKEREGSDCLASFRQYLSGIVHVGIAFVGVGVYLCEEEEEDSKDKFEGTSKRSATCKHVCMQATPSVIPSD